MHGLFHPAFNQVYNKGAGSREVCIDNLNSQGKINYVKMGCWEGETGEINDDHLYCKDFQR